MKNIFLNFTIENGAPPGLGLCNFMWVTKMPPLRGLVLYFSDNYQSFGPQGL